MMLAPPLLNGDSGRTHWANLGDWSVAEGYPAAAQALAARVGKAAGIRAGDHVLDVGCGCGDSCALWVDALGAAAVVGVDPDAEALAVAARTTSARPDLRDRVKLHVGSATTWDPVPATFDAVVAVDAAYHFEPREAFLRMAARALRPGGRLAWGDLVTHNAAGLAPLARAAGIPERNLWDPPRYAAELAAAGFERTETQDLDAQVLDGFSHFVRREAPRLVRQRAQGGWVVLGTGAFASWVRRRNLAHYVLFMAHKR